MLKYNNAKKRYEFTLSEGKETFYISDDLIANSTTEELMTLLYVRMKFMLENCNAAPVV